MGDREVYDRDYARASLLIAKCRVLRDVDRKDNYSLRQGVNAINRLETCSQRFYSDFIGGDVKDLCPYGYHDSLDIEYDLIDEAKLNPRDYLQREGMRLALGAIVGLTLGP
jgi:hypothetical protein